MPPNEPRTIADLSSDEEALELLQELERQTRDHIRRQRSAERISIKVPIVIRPGNSSAALDLEIRGMTADISEGGCRAIFPVPMGVGDIYRLTFDREQLDLPLVFGRCLRCRLICEDSFEAGFSFFTRISLREPAAEQDDLLV